MPKMVEVDEEQLLQSQRLRATVEKIMADPKARVLVEQAHKLVDANAKTPTLDAQKTANEPLEAIQKQVSDFIAAQTKASEDAATKRKLDEIEAKKTSGLAQLRANGWTDEGIKGVEKIMEEQGILDPDIAAAYFEKLHPPQTPIKPGGSGAWNFLDMPKEGDDDLKKLVETKGEHDGLLQKMAMDALAEVRGTSRR